MCIPNTCSILNKIPAFLLIWSACCSFLCPSAVYCQSQGCQPRTAVNTGSVSLMGGTCLHFALKNLDGQIPHTKYHSQPFGNQRASREKFDGLSVNYFAWREKRNNILMHHPISFNLTAEEITLHFNLKNAVFKGFILIYTLIVSVINDFL